MATSPGGCRQTLIPHGSLLSPRLNLNLERETVADQLRVPVVAGGGPNLVQTFSMQKAIRNVAPGTEDPGLVSVQTFAGSQLTHQTLPLVESAGWAGFQTFPTDRDAVPEWVALLALLPEFIETWDVNMGGRRPAAQRIYNTEWLGREGKGGGREMN